MVIYLSSCISFRKSQNIVAMFYNLNTLLKCALKPNPIIKIKFKNNNRRIQKHQFATYMMPNTKT